MSTVVRVGLGDRSYPIIIKKGLMAEIGRDLKERKIAKRWAVISDNVVAELYGEILMKSLAQAGVNAELITFPHGEESKHLQTIGNLASELARSGFDRKDGLIALGGGVSGDITGFLAAIYMRGIPFVQIPTTLLAQVDSSVGGKTGVDIPEGKNLVGCFYQPCAVYIDPVVLKTLPKDEILGGLAEVIKYGVIADAEFFNYLAEKRDQILALEDEAIIKVVARCCELKASVVERDEREGGLRRILNFGHTIGHAVEAASGYRLIHGLAIAIGMRAATDLAVESGYLKRDIAQRIENLIKYYGMPTSVPADMSPEQIKGYLKTDKKTVGGKVFYVLPTEIGEVTITNAVREEHVDKVILAH